jgi:hypothetical protein
MIPREVPYRIAAGSQAVYEIMVVVPQDAEPCFIRAVLEQGEHIVQDVVPVGDVAPLTLSLVQEEGRFVLSLANPNPDYVEGEVALITPLEYWGPAVDTLALGHVGPRCRAFRVGPGAEENLAFTAEGIAAGLWAVAKVSWYGRVQYAQLDAQR